MAEKTEQPTQKKLRDSAKKGQTFKSKDITAVIVIVVGALAIGMAVDLRRVMLEFARVASTSAAPDPAGYLLAWGRRFLVSVVPFVLLCGAAGALPSLIQSRFTLAVESLKLDLTAMSPMKGLKKLFGWRVAKDAVKALLYLVVIVVAAAVFVQLNKGEVFELHHATPALLGHLWIRLATQLVLVFILCALPVLLLDAVAEYFLYYKDMKMDKQEVKQEHKESEGNQEIKQKRKEVHQELLSEEVKSNVKQSDMILANPTHIAIGIYMNADVVPVPFVSVRETNARALAVIRYAESCGVPVVRDIPLARSVYRNSRLYSFVSARDLEPVMRVLTWLRQVEAANRVQMIEAGKFALQENDEGVADGADDLTDKRG
ncbi:EscU/YscU/HrcU family type III secretion system export apparatus switch protein [Burkholderia ubonensis]|uniref:EscU/YscU/HrcU family type III secretion system export apparatus switch protein n=1 Tax=Burkholderia ubonensis TaxID=101571 RepID=UPI0007C6FB48|nr:EscU/YscU/HrcU family type III secretion system export apparatus switch protein [Burkholderia ubonensis]